MSSMPVLLLASIQHLCDHARREATEIGPLHALWESILEVEAWLKTQNMVNQWIPASVGCHWSNPAIPGYTISTFMRGNPDPGQMKSGYGVWFDYEIVGEFDTLTAAQQGAADHYYNKPMRSFNGKE